MQRNALMRLRNSVRDWKRIRRECHQNQGNNWTLGEEEANHASEKSSGHYILHLAMQLQWSPWWSGNLMSEG